MSTESDNVEIVRLLQEGLSLVNKALMAQSELTHQQGVRLDAQSSALQAIATDARQTRSNVHEVKDLLTAMVAQQALIAVNGDKPTSGEWQAAQQEIDAVINRRPSGDS
jgi:hypothetical protein